MNKRLIFIIVLCFLLAVTTVVYAASERSDGYFTILDETGRAVYLTGRMVDVGDQFLTEDNKRYEVYSVSGDTAYANYLGTVNLSKYYQDNRSLWGILEPKIAYAQGGKVAVYHTHDDESYVPTDGAESIDGDGGILKVGDAFAKSLQAKGLEVFHSLNKHDPHDDMAYERSRRTVADLLKKQPDAVFDVHRDAVPPQVYSTSINGQDVSKVQLVVGKYGPTGKQIEDYALQIKAAADNQHPGLIKGIFFAKGGDYNQDLFPRSMLLEVGAHTNSRESAEKGVALFADIVPSIIGKSSPGGGNTGMGTATAGPSGASKATGWIIALLVLGAGGFLLISTGGLKEAGAKLKQFTTTEFTNFLGPRIKRRKIKEEDNTKKEK